MNESDAWREDDLGSRKQKWCVFRLCSEVSMVGDDHISIQFNLNSKLQERPNGKNVSQS